MNNDFQNNSAAWNGNLKRCIDCGEVKPLGEFPPAKRRLDGRGSYCRTCYAERSKASYRKRQAEHGRSVRERRIAPAGQKWCNDCQSFKPLENFCRNKNTKSGRASYCKDCHNARTRESIQRLHGDPREYRLRRRYGIGKADFDQILAGQGGLCAGCRNAPAAHVDHDHETGKVRGLLCFNCNQALGNLRDDLRVMDSLGAYLSRARSGYAPLRGYLPPTGTVIEYVPSVRHGSRS